MRKYKYDLKTDDLLWFGANEYVPFLQARSICANLPPTEHMPPELPHTIAIPVWHIVQLRLVVQETRLE